MQLPLAIQHTCPLEETAASQYRGFDIHKDVLYITMRRQGPHPSHVRPH